MPGDYGSAVQWAIAAPALVLTFGPVLALVLARRTLGPLKAAAWLTVWGALIVAGEHANFGISNALALASEPVVSNHARYHLLMAGVYTMVGAAALAVIALTLLGEGRPIGWYTVLMALVVGGGLELALGGRILGHGLPPNSIPLGLTLYGYFAAWIAALLIGYRPIFRRLPRPGSERDNQSAGRANSPSS